MIAFFITFWFLIGDPNINNPNNEFNDTFSVDSQNYSIPHAKIFYKLLNKKELDEYDKLFIVKLKDSPYLDYIMEHSYFGNDLLNYEYDLQKKTVKNIVRKIARQENDLRLFQDKNKSVFSRQNRLLAEESDFRKWFYEHKSKIYDTKKTEHIIHDAQNKIETLIVKYPKDIELAFYSAFLYFYIKDYKKSLDIYQSIAEKKNNSLSSHELVLAQARTHAANSNHQEAYTLYKKYIAVNPNQHNIRIEMAFSHFLQKSSNFEKLLEDVWVLENPSFPQWLYPTAGVIVPYVYYRLCRYDLFNVNVNKKIEKAYRAIEHIESYFVYPYFEFKQILLDKKNNTDKKDFNLTDIIQFQSEFKYLYQYYKEIKNEYEIALENKYPTSVKYYTEKNLKNIEDIIYHYMFYSLWDIYFQLKKSTSYLLKLKVETAEDIRQIKQRQLNGYPNLNAISFHDKDKIMLDDDNALFWPFKTDFPEYWPDEINGYQFHLNKCKYKIDNMVSPGKELNYEDKLIQP
jgi:hypothetical protein